MPVTPSEKEEQFFKEQELKLRLEKAAAQQQATAEADKHRLKELHWMRCPKCGQALATEHYGAVEVDVCPGCKGLWLDANELDTLLAPAQQSSPLRSFLKIIGR